MSRLLKIFDPMDRRLGYVKFLNPVDERVSSAPL
jgi:hypothetical protein